MALKQREFSKGFQLAADRLMAGHSVPKTAFTEIREIAIAKARSDKPNTNADNVHRSGLQTDIKDYIMGLGSYSGKDEDGKPVYDAPVRKERQLHILLGLPASGKSTIADSLSEITGARIMDSDMAKELIPEYDGGYGAAAVHDESGRIMDAAMDDAKANGDNLILSKTTTDPAKLSRTLMAAQKQGYTCYLHAIDLNPNKAMGRMLERYRTTGRYIPPEIAMEKMGPNDENLILYAFAQVANDKDLCAGWTLWSNDVEFGEPSVLLGRSKDDDPVIDALTEGADEDRSRIIGVEPESEEQARGALAQIYSAIDADTLEDTRRAELLKNPARREAMRQMHAQGSDAERLAKVLEKMDSGAEGDGKGAVGPKAPGE